MPSHRLFARAPSPPSPPSPLLSPLSLSPLSPTAAKRPLDAAFLARGTNFNLALNSTGAIITLPKITTDAHKPHTRLLTRTPIHLHFAGANPAATISPAEPLLEKVNYYNRTNSVGHPIDQVPTFAKLEYKSIYPGIDLTFHGTRRQLEYDFLLAPGADPSRDSHELPQPCHQIHAHRLTRQPAH